MTRIDREGSSRHRIALLLGAAIGSGIVMGAAAAQGLPPLPESGLRTGDSLRSETRIADGMSLYTEYSLAHPYLGEQVSVVYSLRAVRPPSAIDVDPQQFSGFWSEILPLPAQTRILVRGGSNRSAQEFLLRQVVVTPLRRGMLQLPPLSIKVKRAGTRAPAEEDWDLHALSDPVPIDVVSPPGHERADQLPLVGTISGEFIVPAAARNAFSLELEGTANLGWFLPLEWVRLRNAAIVSAQIMEEESSPLIRDMGGKRQILYRQKKKWLFRYLPGPDGPPTIEDLTLRAFDSSQGRWKISEIRGRPLEAAEVPRPATRRSEQIQQPRSRFFSMSPFWFGPLSLGVLALLAWVAVRLIRKSRPARAGRMAGPALLRSLEKQNRTAPKTFIETAARLLQSLDSEAPDVLEDPEARKLRATCSYLVDRYRFGGKEAPPHVRTEILQTIRAILPGQAHSP